MDPALARSTAGAVPGFGDGLGERVLVAEPTTGEKLEVLRLRPSLTAVPSFEFALRERAGRLANFRHTYYARVRQIDRLPEADSRLAIISEHPTGARLSDVLRIAERERLELDINAALCLVRQLVPAVAMLHENARDVAHGALGPERIILTANARLVITEYVLGSAIERLERSREQLWRDLRVAVPAAAGGARFDHRADVTQVGIVALSLLLGRLLRDDEFPDRLGDLLATAVEIRALGERRPLSRPLRTWLARALQLDLRQSFHSAIEARVALDEVLADSPGYVAAPIALESFLKRYEECVTVDQFLAARAAAGPATEPRWPRAVDLTPPTPEDRLRAHVDGTSALSAAVESGFSTENRFDAESHPSLEAPGSPRADDRRMPPPDGVTSTIVAPPLPGAPSYVPAFEIVDEGAKHAASSAHQPAAGLGSMQPPPGLGSMSPAPPASGARVPAPDEARRAAYDTAMPPDRPALEQLLSPPLPPRAAPMPPAAEERVPRSEPSRAQKPEGPAAEPPRQKTLLETSGIFDLSESLAGDREAPPAFQPPAAEEAAEDRFAEDSPAGKPSRRGLWLVVGVVLSACVLGGAWWLFGQGIFKGAPAPIAEGILVVESRPPGAEVIVDEVSRGRTPLTVTLPPGAHRLDLVQGSDTRSVPISIAGGAQVFQYFELQQAPASVGQLSVRSDPPGARVLVDGQARGVAPLVVADLSAGPHSVVLESDLGSVQQTVTIEPGVTSALVVPLNPRGAPVSGWISVSSPVELQFFEGGNLIGTSLSDRVMMSAGRHDIQITNDALGFRELKQVTVTPGRVTSLPISLPRGTLNVNAVPWAEVWIDGERKGETPLGNLSVPIGPHEVVFRNPQFKEQRHAITVTLRGPARLSVDLTK